MHSLSLIATFRKHLTTHGDEKRSRYKMVARPLLDSQFSCISSRNLFLSRYSIKELKRCHMDTSAHQRCSMALCQMAETQVRSPFPSICLYN